MLLIDIGNSRIKWAYTSNGRLVDHGAAMVSESAEALPESATTAWIKRQSSRVAIADVFGGGVVQHLCDWFQARWGVSPEVARVTRDALGVRTLYREPVRLGVDRWLALLAVRDRAPVGVVNCGTAITIDVLDHQLIHRGGLILPGVALQRASLLQRSSGIRLGYEDGEAVEWDGLLGCDTTECVTGDTLRAAAGGIARSVAQISARFESITWIMTGGDGPLLNRALTNQFEYAPDLVLRGLLDVVDGRWE